MHSMYRVQWFDGDVWRPVASYSRRFANDALNDAERLTQAGYAVRLIDPKGNIINME